MQPQETHAPWGKIAIIDTNKTRSSFNAQKWKAWSVWPVVRCKPLVPKIPPTVRPGACAGIYTNPLLPSMRQSPYQKWLNKASEPNCVLSD